MIWVYQDSLTMRYLSDMNIWLVVQFWHAQIVRSLTPFLMLIIVSIHLPIYWSNIGLNIPILVKKQHSLITTYTLASKTSESCLLIVNVQGRRTHKKNKSDLSKAALCDCLNPITLTNSVSICNSHTIPSLSIMLWSERFLKKSFADLNFSRVGYMGSTNKLEFSCLGNSRHMVHTPVSSFTSRIAPAKISSPCIIIETLKPKNSPSHVPCHCVMTNCNRKIVAAGEIKCHQ